MKNKSINQLQPATLTTLQDESRYRSVFENDYKSDFSTVYSSEVPTGAGQPPMSEFYRPLSSCSIANHVSSNANANASFITPSPQTSGVVGAKHAPSSTKPPVDHSQLQTNFPEDHDTLIDPNRSRMYLVHNVCAVEQGKRIVARCCGHLFSFLILVLMCTLFAILIRSFQGGIGTSMFSHGRLLYPIGR